MKRRQKQEEAGTVLIAFALFLFVLLGFCALGMEARPLVHGPRRALEERGRRGAGGREEHLQPLRQPRDAGRASSPRRTSRAATWARPARAPAA